MKNHQFFILSIIIWFFIVFSCDSEKQASVKQERGFDQVYLEKLNKLDDYDYDRAFETASKKPAGSNPVLKFLGAIFSAIAWFFNSLFGYIIIMLLIGLLIWILLKKSEQVFEKKKIHEKNKLVIVEFPEIELKAYHKLVQAALKKQDYRLAIRYGFLSALKYLYAKEMIEWRIDKTNLEYQMELPVKFQELFAGMSMIYEMIWYGNFDANQELFKQMTQKFQKIKTLQG